MTTQSTRKINMRQVEASTLIRQLLPIAKLAGEAVMAVYETGESAIQKKENSTPVTEADLASHRVLAKHLALLLPNCPVVSEEDEVSQTHRLGIGSFWLIDPLDGTKEFIARNGEFTVNISLIQEGRSVLGVVYAPAIDALYWGGERLGAFRSIAGETAPLKVAACSPHNHCRVVASKSHLNPETQSFINQLGNVNLVQAGSSLKFCRIAEGKADIYPRLAPTCEWDTAAAQSVLEGAGGVVVDLDGQPLRYGKPDVLNPWFIATRDVTLIPI
jgi:3'(2'), 5'-bisphosphate nucleotidase